jgi:nucleoside permease NupC
MGVPKPDLLLVGKLLGLKLFGNEFVAYNYLSTQIAAGYPVTDRGFTIATYALAGFANVRLSFPSLLSAINAALTWYSSSCRLRLL